MPDGTGLHWLFLLTERLAKLSSAGQLKKGKELQNLAKVEGCMLCKTRNDVMKTVSVLIKIEPGIRVHSFSASVFLHERQIYK
ncbi:unnamed protein product, partial [marine sediment metagenome]